ncbi:MAG: proteinral secretion pathway protein C [Alphaproteobacteria bacterium]|nr:MAG: proteinral secretion pathway protein C [Alphaproteobacteria bacterium]
MTMKRALLLGFSIAALSGVIVTVVWCIRFQRQPTMMPVASAPSPQAQRVPMASAPSEDAVRPTARALNRVAAPRPTLAPLDATLMGTMLGNGPREHRAFVVDHRHAQRLTLTIGDLLQGRILANVGRGFVRLRRPDGVEELLVIEDAQHPDAVIHAVGLDHYQVDKPRLIEAIRGDVRRLRAETQVRPQIERFKFVGAKLARVSHKGFAAQAGLREGDVIRFVNDTPLESPAAMLAAYHQVRSSAEISLGVERNGETRTLRYTLREP